MAVILKLIRDRSGASAIEYALIASLIAIGAIVGMRGLGGKLLGLYTNVANALP